MSNEEQQSWQWVQSTNLLRSGWGSWHFLAWIRTFGTAALQLYLIRFFCVQWFVESTVMEGSVQIFDKILSVAVRGCVLDSLFPLPFVSLPSLYCWKILSGLCADTEK